MSKKIWYCHKCGKWFGYLGIMMHRKKHSEKNEMIDVKNLKRRVRRNDNR